MGKKKFTYKTLKQEFNQILFLFYGQFLLLLLALTLEVSLGVMGILKFFGFIVLLFLLYKLTYKALHRLYYTYWTLSLFFVLLLLRGLLVNFSLLGSSQAFSIYLLIFGLFVLQTYLLSSPIFYPRVNWWEYDFRYREDWPIKMSISQNGGLSSAKVENRVGNLELVSIKARLTDLRRKAGCVVTFDEFKIGQKIMIYRDFSDKNEKLMAEVMSRREYSIGRGITLGIKFVIENFEDHRIYKEWERSWRKGRKEKMRLKFEGQKSGSKRIYKAEAEAEAESAGVET